eukprot:Nk52_evm2s1224 gene=Nk52_evmTU2s1224
MEQNLLKGISAGLCFFAGLVGLGACLVRAKATSSDSGGVIFAYINAFTAGVFLSIGFVHMLPEASELFSHRGATEGDKKEVFPLANVIAMVVFILTFAVESVIIPHISTHLLLVDESEVSEDISPLEYTVKRENQWQNDVSLSIRALAKDPPFSFESSSVTKAREPSSLGKSLCIAAALFVLLSVHSFFAGLALGVTDSTVDIYSTLFAILLHKSLASFTLGTRLAQTDVSNCVFTLFITMFSAVTPSGIIVGALISGNSEVQESHVLCILRGISLACAAGVFLYVGSSELLGISSFSNSTKSSTPFNLKKLAVVFLASSMMAVLAIWT